MKTMPRVRSRRQRGAALLTAMIIVALVATLASAMVWQQWRAVQVEAAERARAQSAWILTGARDYAGLILREDSKSQTGGKLTALTEPWALPLKEARLSTFLAVDKANTDDGPDAFLSGYINDAQARFNLRSLVPNPGANPDPAALAALGAMQRLCESLGLGPGIAGRIASGLAAAIAGTASAPLEPKTVAQLTWLGIDRDSVTKLQPFVVLIPGIVTPVNVNTASKEVLAAVANIDPGSAERLVQIRQRGPFKSPADFLAKAQIPPNPNLPPLNIAVVSSYFEVSGSLRLTDHVLTESSLVQRANGILTPLQRERISALEQTGR